MSEYTRILGIAWQAFAGERPEPTDVDDFKNGLFERIESVLVDSYIEDLTESRAVSCAQFARRSHWSWSFSSS